MLLGAILPTHRPITVGDRRSYNSINPINQLKLISLLSQAVATAVLLVTRTIYRL